MQIGTHLSWCQGGIRCPCDAPIMGGLGSPCDAPPSWGAGGVTHHCAFDWKDNLNTELSKYVLIFC